VGKMFPFSSRKKNNTSVPTVEITIDAPVYEQLKKHAHMEGVSENEELLSALRKGMRDYLLHVAKYQMEEYYLVEKLFEQSKHDSQTLDTIIKQNERFHEILDSEKSEGNP